MMLFVAFVVCTWLAGRRAEKEGISRQRIQDLAIWVFVGGILGSRLTYVLLEDHASLWQFFRIWDGGLVLYGSVIGGLLAYVLGYRYVIQKHGISSWRLADVVAPSIAVGICLGRIGCFLNGCCYGNVAGPECPDCLQAHFPLSSPPSVRLTSAGYQTAAGFTMNDEASDDRTVGKIDHTSPAVKSGLLQPGDVIVKADGQAIRHYSKLDSYLSGEDWLRGKQDLALTVQRGGKEIDLPSFGSRTLGLHPTQLYESISMLLIFFLLTAYYPFRRRPGEVMALLIFCYGVHRYLNEKLRFDPRPSGFEEYVSIFLVTVGIGLWIWFRRRIPQRSPELAPTT
jgi:phosphatidylglycerol:prolipoprotein diacylglycerol transferase